MRPGISEFSYGYAVTEALVRDASLPLTAAPVFPSLLEEGKEGGGYDLLLNGPGVPLFIQFKLAEYMTGRKGTPEIRDRLFTGPFYRMHLRPLRRSNQHQLLCELEAQGNPVYYIAPAFHETTALNDLYLNKQILRKSVYFKPSTIGPLPDTSDHHVAFQLSGDAYRLSDPAHIQQPFDLLTFTEDLVGRLNIQGEYALSFENVSLLIRSMIDILALDDMFHEQDVSNIAMILDDIPGLLEQLSFLSRVFFECNLFIVRTKIGTDYA